MNRNKVHQEVVTIFDRLTGRPQQRARVRPKQPNTRGRRMVAFNVAAAKVELASAALRVSR